MGKARKTGDRVFVCPLHGGLEAGYARVYCREEKRDLVEMGEEGKELCELYEPDETHLITSEYGTAVVFRTKREFKAWVATATREAHFPNVEWDDACY